MNNLAQEKERIPYLFRPRWYQQLLLESPARYKVAVMHRRSGKTKTILNQQIGRAVSKRGLNLYLLPTYKQAKKVVWQDPEMMAHFPEGAVTKRNDSELFIQFKNGSIWMLGGTDNPDSWRGTNPVDVVFDEYSEMKESMWTEIIRPILTENGGRATFCGTPKGRNHFWRIYNYAKENKGPMWEAFFYNVGQTQSIPETELEQARKEMPLAMYNQEFMCEFLDDAGAVFRRVNENVWSGDMPPEPGKNYQIGVDLAKYQDWTVITIIDLHTFRIAKQERFNQVDWNLQKARIEAVARRYNNAKIMIDATGVGDPVYEDLSRMGLYIEPFRFTEQSRRQLLEGLAIALEQDKIKIPNDEILKDELAGFQYQLTEGERGKLKMTVPEGMHDDCVMSLGLAVWGIKEPLGDINIGGEIWKPNFQKY